MRLSALVVAAMASGYLWRGAVDVQEPVVVSLSPVPAIGFELPDAPLSSLGHLRVRVPRASRPAAKRGVVTRATPPPSSPAHPSGTAQAIAVVEAPQASPARTRRAKHRSRVKGAQPAPRPPAPPVAPPPVTAPEPPPPPPARVETRPGRGKGEKKAKKQKPEKRPKPEKQPKAEKQKDEKGDKEQRKGKEKK